MIAKISFTTLIALFAGIAMSGENVASLNQAFLLWFVFVLVCGLTLPVAEDEKPIKAFTRPLLPVLVFVIAILFILLTKVSDSLWRPPTYQPRDIKMFGTVFPPSVIIQNAKEVLAFSGLLLIGTSVGIALSALSHVYVKRAAVSIWQFGSEGFEKGDRLVRSIITIIGSVLILLAAFS